MYKRKTQRERKRESGRGRERERERDPLLGAVGIDACEVRTRVGGLAHV